MGGGDCYELIASIILMQFYYASSLHIIATVILCQSPLNIKQINNSLFSSLLLFFNNKCIEHRKYTYNTYIFLIFYRNSYWSYHHFIYGVYYVSEFIPCNESIIVQIIQPECPCKIKWTTCMVFITLYLIHS